MNCVSFLESARDIVDDLYVLSSEISAQRERMENITPSYSDMPHGGDSLESQRLAEARLADLSTEYSRKQETLYHYKIVISEFISMIPGNTKTIRREKQFLEFYYCDLFTLEKIASIMDRHVRSVYRLKNSSIILAENYFRTYLTIKKGRLF